ncbi:hypothetical protein Hanom_Chr04g00295711 [Helianthus anomalus]
MLNSSTSPRNSIIPLHTTSFSQICFISNLVIVEATSTSLLNTLLSHLIMYSSFNEGSASSATSTKLGQLYICRTFIEGRASSVTSTKLG